MKLPCLLFSLTVSVVVTLAADPLTEAFQRGLLAEESQRDLKAAAAAYDEVMRQADSQRELVATALFRRAETQRRLGRTNEAEADYRRLLRQFSDQTNLVRLATVWVPRRVAEVSAADMRDSNALAEGSGRLRAELRELETTIAQRERYLANAQTSLASLESARGVGLVQLLKNSYWPQVQPEALARLLSSYDAAQRRDTSLLNEFGAEHPNRKAQQALVTQVVEQLAAWQPLAVEELKKGISASAQDLEHLRNKREALRLRLAQEERDRTQLPASGGIAEQRRLLLEEIKVAEEQAALVRKRLEDGIPPISVTQNDVLQAQRDVLALKRQLAALTRPDLLDVTLEPAAAPSAPERRPRWVSVGGEVKLPGTLKLPDDRSMDLFEAINAQGGLTTKGNRDRILVGRGTNVFRLKLHELMTNRFELQHEDKIQVMESLL